MASKAIDAYASRPISSRYDCSASGTMTLPTSQPCLELRSPEEQHGSATPQRKHADVARPSSFLETLRLKFKSDEELAELLQSGAAEALAILFERHSALVFRVAMRVLRDSAEAEDTVQQIFLDFYRSARKFDSNRGTFKSWLLIFSYHRTLNRKRQLRSRAFYDSDSIEGSFPAVSEIAERRLPFNIPETICLVKEALALIKPQQRRVIEMVYYEGLTSNEIAEQTGDSIRAVRHHLYRGLDKIRSVLRGAAPQPSSTSGGRSEKRSI